MGKDQELMGHDQHSHRSESVSDQGLLWAVILNGMLSVFEFTAGVISGSVALMADALHNTNDAAALLIAYVARRLSRRGADEHFTFGYRRAELIGAMIQLTALVLVGLYLLVEAVKRLLQPEPIEGGWILVAASVAVVVDFLTAWMLWALSKGSLNVKAAFLHNLTDAAASVAVLAGGAAIYWLGWLWVDPILTLVIAGYILYMSVALLRRTASILMEGAHPDTDVRQVIRKVEAIKGVEELHHVHIWELDENHQALEAHVVARTLDSRQLRRLKNAIREVLREQFGIRHSTLEFEGIDEECRHRQCGQSANS